MRIFFQNLCSYFPKSPLNEVPGYGVPDRFGHDEAKS